MVAHSEIQSYVNNTYVVAHTEFLQLLLRPIFMRSTKTQQQRLKHVEDS